MTRSAKVGEDVKGYRATNKAPCAQICGRGGLISGYLVQWLAVGRGSAQRAIDSLSQSRLRGGIGRKLHCWKKNAPVNGAVNAQGGL